MKNLALTSCYNYEWNNIEVVVKSFRKQCPDDEMIVLFYNRPTDKTIERLKDHGVKPVLVISNNPSRIVVERFLAYSEILSRYEAKYAVCVDAADIFFQRNPFLWLQEKLGDDKKVVVGSEQLLYRNEAWGRGNLSESFPDDFEKIKDFEIGNAGSIGGEASCLSKICRHVYDMSIFNKVFNPDQAALNVLLRSRAVEDFVFTTPVDGWSFQCGTSANDARGKHPDYEYDKNLIGCPPKLTDNAVINEHGLPVCIVHQYHHNANINNFVRNSI